MVERKCWSPKEDEALRFLYEKKQIRSWTLIAKLLQFQYGIEERNGKQCRQRYQNHLNPHISKGNWSIQQEKTLIQFHMKFGNRWAFITRNLKGRSDNCVKNHFYSIIRRLIRKLNAFIKENQMKDIKTIKVNLIYKIMQIASERQIKQSINSQLLFKKCLQVKNKLLQTIIRENLTNQNCQKANNFEEIIRLVNKLNKVIKFYRSKISIEYSKLKDVYLQENMIEQKDSVNMDNYKTQYVKFGDNEIETCHDLQDYFKDELMLPQIKQTKLQSIYSVESKEQSLWQNLFKVQNQYDILQ